jgi:hypothetical protein
MGRSLQLTNTMKARHITPDQEAAPDDMRANLEQLDNLALRELSLKPGRIGWQAFIAWTERSLAKRKLSLK